MKLLTTNEYSKIAQGLAVYPCFFDVLDINNKYYGTVNKNIVIDQYNTFINTLINEGVKVNFLNPIGSPAQLYTRDLGFIIRDILFICNLKDPIRKNEVNALIDFVKAYEGEVHIMSHSIEGGDVILHDDKLFIGVGGRTTDAAIEEVVNVLHKHHINLEVIKVIFDTSKIHLDCVFNILDKETCIVTNYLFNLEEIENHFTNTVKVSGEDASALGANIVNLGSGKIICTSQSFASVLETYAYTPIFIDLSEIIKAEGGAGCCILPIYRENPSVK